jgi:hypothetical protein
MVVGAVAASGHAEVDLEGILSLSPSFADELFAKLPAELIESRAVRFRNASDDVTAMVRMARANRARLLTAG